MRNAVLCLVLALGGCDEPEVVDLCRAASLCDTPHPPPNDYVLLCDATPGSTCDRSSLADAVDSVLADAVHRPSSTIELWVVGTDAHDSHLAVSASVPVPPRRLRSIASWEEDTAAALRESLLDAFDPFFAQAATQQRSAIAEALTRVGQSRLGRAGTPAHLVLISDLRQHVPGLSLECPRRLPPTSVLLAGFERRGVLGHEALSAFAEVQVLAHALPPFPRQRGACDVSIRRETDLAAFWSEALAAAGAPTVAFRGRDALFEAAAPTDP